MKINYKFCKDGNRLWYPWFGKRMAVKKHQHFPGKINRVPPTCSLGSLSSPGPWDILSTSKWSSQGWWFHFDELPGLKLTIPTTLWLPGGTMSGRQGWWVFPVNEELFKITGGSLMNSTGISSYQITLNSKLQFFNLAISNDFFEFGTAFHLFPATKVPLNIFSPFHHCDRALSGLSSQIGSSKDLACNLSCCWWWIKHRLLWNLHSKKTPTYPWSIPRNP